MRVEIRTTHSEIPDGSYAVMKPDERPIDAVVRSMERRTRTRCCLINQDCRTETNLHYQATFGRRNKYQQNVVNVAAECWIYVPREGRQS